MYGGHIFLFSSVVCWYQNDIGISWYSRPKNQCCIRSENSIRAALVKSLLGFGRACIEMSRLFKLDQLIDWDCRCEGCTATLAGFVFALICLFLSQCKWSVVSWQFDQFYLSDPNKLMSLYPENIYLAKCWSLFLLEVGGWGRPQLLTGDGARWRYLKRGTDSLSMSHSVIQRLFFFNLFHCSLFSKWR